MDPDTEKAVVILFFMLCLIAGAYAVAQGWIQNPDAPIKFIFPRGA